jgi:nitrite reductase (NADH) small subunit
MSENVVNLGPASRIPLGEGRMFVLGERTIAVFRTRGGRVFATQALCPHREGPLADGLTGGGRVVCPLHGLQFELADGQAVGHACGDLETYPVRVSDSGDLLLREPGAGRNEAA